MNNNQDIVMKLDDLRRVEVRSIDGIKMQLAGFFVAALASGIWIAASDQAQPTGGENIAKVVALIAAAMILGPLVGVIKRSFEDGGYTVRLPVDEEAS